MKNPKLTEKLLRDTEFRHRSPMGVLVTEWITPDNTTVHDVKDNLPEGWEIEIYNGQYRITNRT